MVKALFSAVRLAIESAKRLLAKSVEEFRRGGISRPETPQERHEDLSGFEKWMAGLISCSAKAKCAQCAGVLAGGDDEDDDDDDEDDDEAVIIEVSQPIHSVYSRTLDIGDGWKATYSTYPPNEYGIQRLLSLKRGQKLMIAFNANDVEIGRPHFSNN